MGAIWYGMGDVHADDNGKGVGYAIIKILN